MRNNRFLKPLHKDPEWRTIEQSYNNLRIQFEMRIDSDLREEVRLMFRKDQKRAMGALFRIGNKAQERYGIKKFAKKDTLYSCIKSTLVRAIEKGEMSRYEYALIDDWQNAVVSERTVPGYGFLISPKNSTLLETNQLRHKIGLRSIELRNKLVDVERKTGLNFYLPNWIKGEINID